MAVVAIRPLAEIASRTLFCQRRGLMRSRRLLDNLVDFEAGVVEQPHVAERLPSGVLLDFANSFPPMAHSWVLRVLCRRRVTLTLIHPVAALYHDLRSTIIYNGQELLAGRVDTGIEQGCRLSGARFALAHRPSEQGIPA